MTEQGKLPTLVSFYAGDKYYYDSAEALIGDCERLGMPYDIVELDSEGLDWGQITRLKVNFYREMQRKHGAILWMDVDNRLYMLPEVLRGCKFDLVGFGGRYRYIRDYDPFQTTRFWIPAILYFGGTERATKFLDLMSEIEAKTDGNISDDFVLQEAWMQHTEQLNIGFLAPEMVARRSQARHDGQVFYHGDSGNVQEFKGKMVQHQRLGQDPLTRTRVLGEEAVSAMKRKDRATAVKLANLAHDAMPEDPESAIRLSRYRKIAGNMDGSFAPLLTALDSNPEASDVRLELAQRYMDTKKLDDALAESERLAESTDLNASVRAQAMVDDIKREMRAANSRFVEADRPVMWWMKTPYPGNFGDILSPWMVEWVSGMVPKFGARGTSLLAIGSIIKFATDKSMVWGSGTPRRGDELAAGAKYLAVRGPITREEVLASGGYAPQIYGDAALLLPDYVQGNTGPKTHKLGVIRHVSQNQSPVQLDDNVMDIRLDGVGESYIRSVIDQITSCDSIISTSLHGVIVAQAYGVPVQWAILEDAHTPIAGDGTKFEDYFLSVGVEPQKPLILNTADRITEAASEFVGSAADLQFDKVALADALREGLFG